MSLLVRKIEAAKWRRTSSHDVADVPADAITGCTRTSGNRLSVWRIEQQEDLGGAVLAMAAMGSQIETMDFVVLKEADLVSHELKLAQSPSTTPVTDFVDRHFDIVDLTYASLGRVATVILALVRANQVARFTKAQLRELLLQAVKDNRVDRDALNEKLQLAIPAQLP